MLNERPLEIKTCSLYGSLNFFFSLSLGQQEELREHRMSAEGQGQKESKKHH